MAAIGGAIAGWFGRFDTVLFVLVAALLDRALGADTAVFRDAVIWFYIANEGLSIMENMALAGVPFLEKLKKALEQLKTKNDTPTDTNKAI